MKKIKLFQLDRQVRRFYYTTEPACCQRLSNNSEPKFTDIQATVIYLYGLILGFHTKISVYNFAKQHLLRYCEYLPTYKQFCLRVNNLAPVFKEICNGELTKKRVTTRTHLADSVPIIVAKGNRSGIARTASEVCDKGYCASKKMWYYGVKIHIIAEERPHHAPIPRFIELSKASENDLPQAKTMLETLGQMDIFADKAYIDEIWRYNLENRDVELNTPFKERSKNQVPLDDGERAWNAYVSSHRQPIESLFSQILSVTGIQNANVVRSEEGLLSFIWARLAVMAILYW
jgi:hypothetical protein